MLPSVVIIGRPNVGKSTLFNKLTQSRKAIVHKLPGVTRDCKIGVVNWQDYKFNLTDTGGLMPEDPDLITTLIREKAISEINSSDLIIFMIDVKEGVITTDQEIAKILFSSGKPIIAVGNKADVYDKVYQDSEIYSLGFPYNIIISAEHSKNLNELLDTIIRLIPKSVIKEKITESATIAIVGKPNVGKSTFINKLLNQKRVLVSEIPGTTRDVIDVEFKYNRNSYILLDTAGIRKKSSISKALEIYSVLKARATIEKADIVLLMIDSTEELGHQDIGIGCEINEKGRGAIILLNKWDLVREPERKYKEIIDNVRDRLSILDYAPILTISALEGKRVLNVMKLIENILQNQKQQIPTSILNRSIQSYYNDHYPPAAGGGKHIKFNYSTIISRAPCRLIIFTNQPNLIPFSYSKYIINRLRSDFPLEGIPVHIKYRKK